MINPGTAFPNVYYPYITFTVGGRSLTWSGADERPDYFMSLTQNRYVNQANTATVQFSFVPTNKLDDEGNVIDANYFERVLASAYQPDPNINTENSQMNMCMFQYGIAGYKSKVYRGMLTTYSLSFANGYLTYTLSLVSQAVCWNGIIIKNTRYNVPGQEDRYSESENRSLIWNSNNSDIFRWWFKVTAGLTAFADAAYDRYTIYDLLYVMYQIVDDFMGDYYLFDVSQIVNIQNPRGAIDNIRLPECSISVMTNNPIEALREIARNLRDATSDAYYYAIVVDDDIREDNRGRIKLVRCGGLNPASDDIVEFSWNNRDSTILNWSVDFNGTAALFNNVKRVGTVTEVINNATNNKVKFSTKNFVEIAVPTANSEVSSWDPEEYYRTKFVEALDFTRRVNYPYTAKLTTLGLKDSDYELCKTHIKVNPVVNGTPHHSAGTYMILGITDQIGTNGFTTELSLVKDVEETASDETSVVEGESVSEVVEHLRGGGLKGFVNSEMTN